MELSYPDGPATIPERKRPYFDMMCDGRLADFIPPATLAAGLCQELKGGVPGYEFRLGSSSHPHLKLRVQLMSVKEREVWVYSVDTHDRCVVEARHLSAEEQLQWVTLVKKNGDLKLEIEHALAAHGLMTQHGLLRLDDSIGP